MAKDSFWEAYEHPKWQQMRLRIMERDGFACVSCEERDKPLHVHHTYYERNAKPWEYQEQSIVTLCAPCHREAEKKRLHVRESVGLAGFHHADRVSGYALGLRLSDGDATLPERLSFSSYEEAQGIADAFSNGASAQDVIRLAQNGTVATSELRALFALSGREK